MSVTIKTAKAVRYFLSATLISSFVIFAPAQAQAGNYNLKYHSSPNSQKCKWVYKRKWVYGKKVRVKVKVCK